MRTIDDAKRAAVGTMLAVLVGGLGCGRGALVQSELPIRRVVIYRNGVAYFERAGHVDRDEVRFKMRQGEVGDFLATLAVMEQGGSSVRSAAFPLKDASGKPRDDKARGPGHGAAHRGAFAGRPRARPSGGYVAASPVWRPPIAWSSSRVGMPTFRPGGLWRISRGGLEA